MWKRLVIFSETVVIFGSVIQMLASKGDERLTKRRIAECLLSWSLPINGGFLEIVGFLWQVVHRKENAERMGLPASNSLQSEIAVAHLAFGVLGLLSFWFRGRFWLATAVGQATFLTGTGVVHARELLEQKIYLFDVLMSLAHIALLMAYKPLEAQPHPTWRRAYRR
jgi:hypothetical protein